MYQIAVKDIAVRTQTIAAKCDAADQVETFYQHTVPSINLPVIDIELGLPIYRLANYRTQTEQMSHVRTKHLSEEFFKNGQENLSAQQAQHSILVEFSKLGSGDSIIPIYGVLQEGRQQNESLLITREGVVVNGNRRLAAMRELYAAEPHAYPAFTSVRAKVLPAGLTAIEIKRIETRLQMTPQTLLPYDWINEALAIRDLKSLGLSNAEIVAEMKLSDSNVAQEALDQLAEAELFLAEYLKAPLQYEKVIHNKQQFIELRKALERQRDAVKKELARKISYVLTHNSEDLGRRAYDYRIAYGAELDKVVSELSERLGVAPPNEIENANIPADDLFADGSPPVEESAGLLERLNDVSQSKAIAEEISEICNNIRESEQRHNLSNSDLRKATKAHTLLSEITLETAAAQSLPAIAAQLQSILSRSTELLNAVKQRQSAP